MTEKEAKAIAMLNKYISEHKFYNIRQSDNLESNIETVIQALEQKDKEIQELNADRVEKDKIIDLMARHINSTDKDEDVCRETGATYNCTEYHDCEECILEYFKKKAREENE